MMVGRSGRQRKALHALEGRLSDSEAAQFRWWAWAQRRGSHAAARVSLLNVVCRLQFCQRSFICLELEGRICELACI